LNTYGESNVYANTSNQICLKLFPRLSSVEEVKPYEVPVRIRDLDILITNHWDLTLHQVVPFIDNISCVKRIAIRSGVDLPLVEKCLRQLLYYKCITMIDIFQYSNVYTPTERISELYRNKDFQEACVQYVTKVKPPIGILPSWKIIFRLYTNFQRGLRLREYIKDQNISTLNIDIHKLVIFGILNKIIRRVHKYPVGKEGLVEIRLQSPTSPTITRSNTDFFFTLKNEEEIKLKQQQQQQQKDEENINDLTIIGRMMDSTHSFDEICCLTNMPFAFLERQVRSDERCVIISR